jgi:hypothetical protein
MHLRHESLVFQACQNSLKKLDEYNENMLLQLDNDFYKNIEENNLYRDYDEQDDFEFEFDYDLIEEDDQDHNQDQDEFEFDLDYDLDHQNVLDFVNKDDNEYNEFFK